MIINEKESTKVKMNPEVKEGIDFISKFFTNQKNKQKYPKKFTEARRLFKIGIEANRLGEA